MNMITILTERIASSLLTLYWKTQLYFWRAIAPLRPYIWPHSVTLHCATAQYGEIYAWLRPKLLWKYSVWVSISVDYEDKPFHRSMQFNFRNKELAAIFKLTWSEYIQ